MTEIKGFMSLNDDEMLAVDGGGWLGDALTVFVGGLLIAGGFVVTVAGAGTLNAGAACAGLGAMTSGATLINNVVNK